MDKRELTAPCGLDCFNCPSYAGNITEEWQKRIAEYLHLPFEDAPCKGCRGENGRCKWGPSQECATWECIQAKGVEFCHECGDFPCGHLLPTKQGADFPHNMKVYNLCRMKLIGLDAWIEESATIRKRYYEGKFLVGQGPVLENI